jgi:hypothetical protein
MPFKQGDLATDDPVLIRRDDTLAALRTELAECQQLNREVQAFLRQWSRLSLKRNPATMLDQASMPWFAELNRSLNDTLDTPGFIQRIRDSHAQLQTLAAEILQRALSEHPDLNGDALAALLPRVSCTDRETGTRMLPEAVC